MKIPEIPIEGRGTIESAGHSGMPRIQRKIEQGNRERDLAMSTQPIPLPEAPEEVEELPYTLKIEEEEEDVDDEPTVIGAAAMAPIQIVIPKEQKKE